MDSPTRKQFAIQSSKDGMLHLRVRAQPGASRESIRLETDGVLRLAVRAKPVGGAANRAVAACVAKRLGIARGAVTVVRGLRGRDKTLAIEGINKTEAQARLEALAEQLAGEENK